MQVNMIDVRSLMTAHYCATVGRIYAGPLPSSPTDCGVVSINAEEGETTKR